jgi:hypothetical protein
LWGLTYPKFAMQTSRLKILVEDGISDLSAKAVWRHNSFFLEGYPSFKTFH